MAALSLKQVRKQYGETHVLRGIDLDIGEGEFAVFVGPSGCGKSTLLRMIAGLETISDGQITIGGRVVNDVHASDRGISMVFQSYALYPHMTVSENMGFALKLAGQSKGEVDKAVKQAAEILQIGPLLDRKPAALSGGQRQRVAIGRSIVRKPRVFLFDEPLSNLDAALRMQMRVELSRLHAELGTTMIYVTHDQVEAMTLGDRIAVFNGGKVEQVGPPLALYNEPANLFVAGFLGSPKMNFIPCRADHSTGQRRLAMGQAGTLAWPGDLAGVRTTNAPLKLGVRPEHFQLSTNGEGVMVRVSVVEFLGDCIIIHAQLDGLDGETTPLSVRLSGQPQAPAPGEYLRLAPEPGVALLFDDKGKALH